jgi:hypothetical protein
MHRASNSDVNMISNKRHAIAIIIIINVTQLYYMYKKEPFYNQYKKPITIILYIFIF